MAQRASKPPERFLAGSDSSTHCPYRRLWLRLWVIGSGLGLVSFGDIWVLRLVTFWDVWALVYLGLTWLLIMRSSAQQTRQWALDQRMPPHPHLSILRSVILRVLRTLFLVSRTSSLFFIVFVSVVSMALAIRLVPAIRDLETTGGLSVAFMAALGVISAWGVLHTSYALHYAYMYYDPKNRPEGLPFQASKIRTNSTSPTSLSPSLRALPSLTWM